MSQTESGASPVDAGEIVKDEGENVEIPQDAGGQVEGNSGERDVAVVAGTVVSPETHAEQGRLALPGSIVMISGCTDAQTSMDISDVGVAGLKPLKNGAGGACTSSFLSTISSHETSPSWFDLLNGVRKHLQENQYTQVPQLSCNSKLDLQSESFSLLNAGRHEKSKTRAVLIGINYFGKPDEELEGCINDVLAVKEFLIAHGYGGSEEEMRVLADDGENIAPTGKNIIAAFRWLVHGAKPGDSLYLHFSGHGAQAPDSSGDEQDGLDEILLPVDYSTNGFIRDDVLWSEVAMKLPKGTHLTAFFDCCHSGTILDLPYIVRANGDFETNWAMIENPGFSFKKVLRIGKQAIDTMEDAIVGGLENLANFFKGFGNVFPM